MRRTGIFLSAEELAQVENLLYAAKNPPAEEVGKVDHWQALYQYINLRAISRLELEAPALGSSYGVTVDGELLTSDPSTVPQVLVQPT